MAEKLEMYNYTGTVHVTIPIHGPEVKPDIIMEFLKDHMKDATPTIFHFDIAPTVSEFYHHRKFLYYWLEIGYLLPLFEVNASVVRKYEGIHTSYYYMNKHWH